jgi:hypothetical protein
MIRATVHDLKTLIVSFQPVVAIDSVEDERVESLVLEMVASPRQLDTTLLLSTLEATVPLSISRRQEVHALRAYASGRFVPVH